MANQAQISGKKGANCGEGLEPMLCYCSTIIDELSPEDTQKLTEDLLDLVKNFRPLIKPNKSVSLPVELG